MPSTPRVLLKVTDVAEILALSERHVYRLINAGHIDAVHIGKAIRVTSDSVDDYVDSLLHSPFPH